MAQSSNPPLHIVVVGSQFCAPYPVDLTIAKKLMPISEASFEVLDVNGKVVFKVERYFRVDDQIVLFDAAGIPLVSMQEKIFSAYKRWDVYRGNSTNSRDRLFSVKKSTLLRFSKTQRDVFLAANTKEDACDFKVKGWFERSCDIYSGDTNNIVAQIHKKQSVRSVVLGQDTFEVTVYPHVDSAFITSLIVVLNEINQAKEN